MKTLRHSRRALIAAALALVGLSIAPLAATAQQTLYVVDGNGTSVVKVAPGGVKSTFVSAIGSADALALDPAGNLYVGYGSASGYGGGVHFARPDGTVTEFTGYPLINTVTAIAFDANGNLFDSEYGYDSTNLSTMHKISPGGVVTTFAKLPGPLFGDAFDAAGNLYVASWNTGSIYKIAPDGTQSIFAGGFNDPYGLVFDAAGNLYVSNYANGNGSTVIKITPLGAQSTFASGLSGPTGMSFDQDGNLCVANYTGGTITKITPAGATSVFASGFSNPYGILFSAPTIPAVTTVPNATASVGTAYSYQVAASNNPTSYSAVGLPSGLSLNASTGVISGTPDTGGAYTISLFAANAYGTGSGILTLAITPGASLQTLYVTENGSTITEVAPDGTQSQFVTGVGGVGPITLDGSDNVYAGTDVGSGYGGYLVQFSPAGAQTYLASYPNIANPTGLALDSNGNVFEADNTENGTNSVVHKVTPSGTVTSFATLPGGLYGDAFDSLGNLYVVSTGANLIAKITPAGAVSNFATGLDEPNGLAIDANDNVYVANNANGFGSTVSKITPAGVVSTYATGLQAPNGLALDQYGNLYVANYANHGGLGGTVTEITPAGAKGTFASGFTNPIGIAFAAATGSAPSVLAPAITSAITESAQAGTAFSYQITATNIPTGFSASGLPAGLNVDTGTGLISGTPAASGVFAVTLSATNSGGTGTAMLTLSVAPALPVVSLVATTPSVITGSGGIAEFTLSLSAAQDHDVVVSFAIKGTAANGTDYVLIKSTKKIKAGKTSKPIKIEPLGDLGGAAKKTVKLVLEPGNGYTVGTTGKVGVSIRAGQ